MRDALVLRPPQPGCFVVRDEKHKRRVWVHLLESLHGRRIDVDGGRVLPRIDGSKGAQTADGLTFRRDHGRALVWRQVAVCLSRKQGFREVHVHLVETVVEACHQAGVKRLLHMSALQADQASGSSQYLRSKGEGENRAHTLGQPDIAVTSFRPSVIFGPDDSFLNRFAALVKIPGPMPLACADARFAPIYVEDVVQAFANALEDRSTFGQRYELCGPEEFTLEEIVRLVAFHTGHYKEIIRLPDWASRLQASLLQFVPGKPLTPDNYLSLRTASVCTGNDLAELGVTPTPMRECAARFLGGSGKAKKLSELRRHSAR